MTQGKQNSDKKNGDKKYVTLAEGTDFRKIATIMTEAGYQMNHATARNVLMTAMKKVIKSMSNSVGHELNEESLNRLLQSPGVHKAFGDILYDAYELMKDEVEENERRVEL